MTEKELRGHVARQVVLYNAALFAILILYRVFPAFDEEDSLYLFGVLVPLTATYFGAYVNFLQQRKYQTAKGAEATRPLNPDFVRLTKWIVPLHFWILVLSIGVCGLFRNLISFDTLKHIFTWEEAFFGGYSGMIISGLFNEKSS